MGDDHEPPRKFYHLKPKEFDRVNPAPSDNPAAPPTRRDAGAHLPDTAARIDVRDLARQAAGTAPLLGVNAPVNRANEVHAILQQNLDRANAAGLNDVPPAPRRRSRRTRDYFLLLIPVDAFFAFAAFGPGANLLSFIFGLAGLAAFTASLTWVMWFVMDDY